jgi:hypothetical protein
MGLKLAMSSDGGQFKGVSQLNAYQGEQLDTVEGNMEAANDDAARGNRQLLAAVKSKKSRAVKTMALTGAVCVCVWGTNAVCAVSL